MISDESPDCQADPSNPDSQPVEHENLFTTANADIALLRQIDLSKLPADFHSTDLMTDLNATIDAYNASDHQLTMRYEASVRMHNGFGVIHGGILSTMLDQAMINSLFLAEPELPGSVSLSMTVNFIGALASEVALITAKPEFSGNRIAQLSARCVDGNDKEQLVATATSTVLLRRNKNTLLK